MDSIENAKIAIEKLNNTVIFQDGSKINVYFSDREEINFQNNNSGGCGKKNFYFSSLTEFLDFSLKKQRSPDFKGFFFLINPPFFKLIIFFTIFL